MNILLQIDNPVKMRLQYFDSSPLVNSKLVYSNLDTNKGVSFERNCGSASVGK